MLFDNRIEWFFNGSRNRKYITISEDDINNILSLAYEDDAWAESMRQSVDHMPMNVKATRLGMYTEFLGPKYINGTLFSTRYGKTIITFDSKRHLYRGENQIFSCSIPSLNRKLKGLDTRQQELYRAVANLRVTQFSKFVWGFNIVRYWQERISDINYKALAQHYGFDTHLLDLTNNFRVALFFATCKYVPETDSYAPLSKKDIEDNDAYKYGMIYHSPNSAIDSMDFRANSMWMCKHQYDERKVYSFDSGELDGLAFQVGHQPLMRCHSQSGYIFPMRNDLPIQKDNRFEKLRFRQSPKLSQRVFDMMEGGNKVFPSEGVSEVKDTLDLIKKSIVFSEHDIEDVFEYEEVDKGMFQDIDSFREALDGMNYEGSSVVIQKDEVEYPISDEMRNRIDARYGEVDLMKQFGGKLRYFRTI